MRPKYNRIFADIPGDPDPSEVCLSVNVDEAMRNLLQREDTDKDGLITIDDRGPKVCLSDMD